MAKNSVADWDTTAANNTDVGGVNIGEGCLPSNINNGMREMMAQIRSDVGVTAVAKTWTAPQTFPTATAVSDATAPTLNLSVSSTVRAFMSYTESTAIARIDSDGTLVFAPNNAEAARLTVGGRLLVGATADTGSYIQVASPGTNAISASVAQVDGINIDLPYAPSTGTATFAQFRYGGAACGNINATSAALTTYATTSDYRIKPKARDIDGFSSRIDAVRPREWNWFTEDGETGRGFVAHEFANVYPSSVTGEKDAINEDGSPKLQSMQAGSSEVLADIFAELQSLRRRVAELEAELSA